MRFLGFERLFLMWTLGYYYSYVLFYLFFLIHLTFYNGKLKVVTCQHLWKQSSAQDFLIAGKSFATECEMDLGVLVSPDGT